MDKLNIKDRAKMADLIRVQLQVARRAYEKSEGEVDEVRKPLKDLVEMVEKALAKEIWGK